MTVSQYCHLCRNELVLLLLFLCLCLNREIASAATLNDGAVHNFATSVASLHVSDSPDGLSTTVNVVEGADISFLYGHGSSLLRIEGGEISHLYAQDSATFAITAGDISHMTAFDGSYMTVEGLSGGFVSAKGSSISNGWSPSPNSSHVEVFSGTYATVTAWATGVLDFRGGNASHARSSVGGILNVHGGIFTGAASAKDNSTINIFGGTVSFLDSNTKGTINVYGGQIGVIRDLRIINGQPGVGIINIYGRELNWSGVQGDHLVGTLLDGSVIDAPVLLKIGLLRLHVVPEQASWVLVGLAAASTFINRSFLRLVG